MKSWIISVVLVSMIFLILIMENQAQLSPTFYSSTCPNALNTIRTSIRQAISRERRMAGSLIRLHFHDCFAQGCDASVLLEQTPTINSEQSVPANSNFANAFNVIETTKREVERICPLVVSCADILAVAARDASVAVGGPSWQVKLGRRDSTDASLAQANDLPASFEDLDTLLEKFSRKNLNARDMVALSGAHTIGQAQYRTFCDRIYNNESNIDVGFASTKRRRCPRNGGDSNLASLDLVTPNSFDNNYFRNLMQRRGLLHSDQVLFNGGSTDSIVAEYNNGSSGNRLFLSDFAAAMIKMGDIEPLTGQNGIIRRICSAIN